jgi:hypothetical protein
LRFAQVAHDDPVPGYHTYILDGKRLDSTEHRLEETRHLKSSPLPGTVLVDAYGRRWTIETCLGHVAQVSNAEFNTLAYPGAALLCFCLALVLFNVLSAEKALLKAYAGKAVRPLLSYYYMAAEVAEARLGMELTIGSKYWEHVSTMPLREFLMWVKALIRHVDWERYRAQPRDPKRPPPKRTSGKRRAHVSPQKILEKRTSLV